ncbi:MAG TPA: malto-oligosyltrehalose synthase, partial [Roseiflexaceae bacterium]|nr:malto-oligosyltrehalose synthase [Roseiflexaceae bacterium]
RQFTFADALRRIAYLHELGISDIYTSPYLRARAESTHGYDIANHNQLNPAIGGEVEYLALVAELHARGMGQILDIVPNHMGIGESSNTWWMDVLENGPSSRYAPFFDIDWRPLKDELENKVLLPILGQQYGRVLENCELVLSYQDGAFFLRYWQTELPINPRTYVDILRLPLEQLIERLGDEHESVLEYQSIITGLEHLPQRTETERPQVIERGREKEILKRRLAALADESSEIRAAIEQTVQLFNGQRGDPRSFDLLNALIERQAYRLSYWRVAAEEINYRRFFDVNDLAAIRMERPEVFEATHQLVLRLLAEGHINGLRIDHIDGLWDPAGYFRRLQESYLHVIGDRGIGDGEHQPSQPPSPNIHPSRPLYIVAEKILAHGERLPADWAIHGTSGYDFLNALNGIFVDGSNERRFSEIYADFIGERLRMDRLVYETRKQIMRIAMASEINVLAYQLNRISEHNRYYRDFTLYSLREALREVIACFPVYRTYILAETDHVEERDRLVIETAVNRARSRNPTIDPSIYDFLRDILLLRYPDTLDPEAREEQRTFVMKFQQMTGPVMAKGMEDTAFYIYNRLTSLNEVGGEPQRFGATVAAFHRQNQERLRDWPAAMLATSTHDTKRAEDVRARINVLSELPEQWRKALTRWSRLNRRKKIEVDGKLAPDRNEEYLLYQTLLGAWPFEMTNDERRTTNDGSGEPSSFVRGLSSDFVERIQAYMIKAIREAKVNTSWLNPNTSYDQAVRAFVAAILEDRPGNRFLADLRGFHATVAHFGAFGALSQTLLKLASPGVPDIYQGSEIWDFSLVDPDNRRSVDYDLRAWWLGELVDSRGSRAELARALVESKADGRIKLYLTHRALRFRRDHAELFRAGSYTPLEATGDAAEHIVAFARTLERPLGQPVAGAEEALAVAPRLLAKRLGDSGALPLGALAWGAELLALPGASMGQRYRNIFTDQIHSVVERDGVAGLTLADLLAHFPVALLERIPGEDAAEAVSAESDFEYNNGGR